jgi:hypothetical protein
MGGGSQGEGRRVGWGVVKSNQGPLQKYLSGQAVMDVSWRGEEGGDGT